MELTREDLIRAADRAETYPPGYGHLYSCSPRGNLDGRYLYLLEKGQADPTLGCPSVAIATARPNWDLDTIVIAHVTLVALWASYADSTDHFDTALNCDPKGVASELRRIAMRFASEGAVPCT